MQPRNHHYIFAHVAMRNMFLTEPQRFISALKKQGRSFLEAVWDRVGDDLPKEEVLPHEQISLDLRNSPDSTLAIIALPPAEIIAEAILVGCYLPKKTNSKGQPRFFTLEFGFRDDGTHRTVFCEWNSGSHLNFGDGPEATTEAFSEAIALKVQAENSPNGLTCH